MQRESVLQSLLVATCLCIVCSVLVSSAAVALKPWQEANKVRQMQTDVLRVAGRYQPDAAVAEQFKQVEPRVVELATGKFVDPESLPKEASEVASAVRDPELSIAIAREDDLAGLKRRENYATVFLIHDAQGKLEQLILPIRGKGLWSTIYGFLSLEADLRTVHGITFYEHGETPGLGGEIQSDKFRRQWHGKFVRDEDGTAHFDFVRGSVSPDDPAADYKIDGIAGATITSRGVINMIRFWMGPVGFQPLLDQMGASRVAAERPLRSASELVQTTPQTVREK